MINWIYDELWDNMLLWDYNIIIKIEYKCKVEHVLIREIHVNMQWWIMTLWDVKLWIWDMIVNKCMVNTWSDNTCVVSCELYNNPTNVYLEKNVYAWSVKRKV